ncbi:MAG: DUF5662 family protein [Lachnospiraceae bacterium]|nr:DUF5662 family protein [Lachnospiraceae bacterium]
MRDESDYLLYKQKNFFQRFFGHLNTVLVHKKYVFRACADMGIFWQGVFHDTSKFSLAEFPVGVKYWSGKFSPNAVDRHEYGYSRAWLHHKGRNKHHYEYWADFSPRTEAGAIGCRMPLKYVAEMIADRYAACKSYHRDAYKQTDAWDYYCEEKDNIVIHEETRAILEKTLQIMADEGEKKAFAYMKNLLKEQKMR